MKNATHIILSYPSRKTDLLYRASDGCSLGCRIEQKILDGEDPNPATLKCRNYLDETYALMALKAIADRDCGGVASFDIRDAESRIVKPNGQIISLEK